MIPSGICKFFPFEEMNDVRYTPRDVRFAPRASSPRC